jgi:hypothetical protein
LTSYRSYQETRADYEACSVDAEPGNRELAERSDEEVATRLGWSKKRIEKACVLLTEIVRPYL